MLKTMTAAFAFALALSSGALAGDGLIQKQSANNFEDTIAKLEAALEARDIRVMNKIDHAAAAANASASLRPTTLILFGNPAIGSQLMATSQTIGIDLPLKALVFEDEDGNICVEVNDIKYLARRHGIPEDHPVVQRIAGGLAMVSDAAIAAD